ncbi:YdeI/OmpD-associated family protein [Qipengyuania nanhaisediminis]|uniref:YdeI/OmpD-associated family protein n=1 Tax=Qipengyuania nanhaisediminis TaxID=604088 RepID=UPI0038B3D695
MAGNPKVDDYIERAQPFAQPILRHLRDVAGRAEPEAVEETRWGAPFWILEGRQLCGMASFKQHCAFILEGEGGGEAMGELGRITSLDDLPSDDELTAMIRAKAARIRSGEDAATKKAKAASPKDAPPTPDDFAAAIAATPGAQEVFDNFTAAQRRDYITWITSAKREETRQKRIAEAAKWIGDGKRKNWKYENC